MQILQTSRPPVPRTVAGDSVVTTDLLRRKLGRTSFLVWQILITRRDARGYTHTTRVGMTHARAFENLSEKTIKRALVRLRAAGLVVDVGWRALKLKSGATVDAYWRLVHGARIGPDGSQQRALVPATVAAWLAAASGHGGARLGAGRPREPVLRLIEGGAVGSEAHQPYSSGAKPPAPEVFKRGHQVISLVGSSHLSSSSLRSEEEPGVSLGTRTNHAQHKPTQLDARNDGARMTWSGDEEQGRIFRPARLSTPAPAWIHNDAVPPWPTLERVPRACIPRPPQLDASLGPQRKRSTLARWYSCAAQSRFGKNVRGHNAAMAYIGSRKVAMLLDDAARCFVEQEIAPAAWCAWMCDVHLRMSDDDDKKKLPPIWIVFSRAVIEKRADWFRSEADTIGGRVVASPASQRLSDLYYRMQLDLRDARAVTPELSRPIVERYFPGSLYQELCDRAHTEAASMQISINQAAKTGDRWLW